MAYLQLEILLGGQADELTGLTELGSDGLFHKDVLSSQQGGFGQIVMSCGGGRDIHSVTRVQQLLIVPKRFYLKLLGQFLTPLVSWS